MYLPILFIIDLSNQERLSKTILVVQNVQDVNRCDTLQANKLAVKSVLQQLIHNDLESPTDASISKDESSRTHAHSNANANDMDPILHNECSTARQNAQARKILRLFQGKLQQYSPLIPSRFTHASEDFESMLMRVAFMEVSFIRLNLHFVVVCFPSIQYIPFIRIWSFFVVWL
jgi:hypothetical protein